MGGRGQVLTASEAGFYAELAPGQLEWAVGGLLAAADSLPPPSRRLPSARRGVVERESPRRRRYEPVWSMAAARLSGIEIFPRRAGSPVSLPRWAASGISAAAPSPSGSNRGRWLLHYPWEALASTPRELLGSFLQHLSASHDEGAVAVAIPEAALIHESRPRLGLMIGQIQSAGLVIMWDEVGSAVQITDSAAWLGHCGMVRLSGRAVCGLGHYRGAAVLALTLVAHTFHCRVVVPGVVNLEQLNRLAAIGCDEAQGPYIRSLVRRSLHSWRHRPLSSADSAVEQMVV